MDPNLWSMNQAWRLGFTSVNKTIYENVKTTEKFLRIVIKEEDYSIRASFHLVAQVARMLSLGDILERPKRGAATLLWYLLACQSTARICSVIQLS